MKDKLILDINQGIYIFSTEGNLSDTVYHNSRVKIVENGTSTVDGRGGQRMCLIGNMILYAVPEDNGHFNDGPWMLGFYDIDNMKQAGTVKISKSRPPFGKIYAVNHKSYALTYKTLFPYMPYMLQTFGLAGDTLCRFSHDEKITDFKGASYSNPEGDNAYYFNEIFTFRHAYNDTIFRITSPERLLLAYILKMGKYKLDINDAVRSNTKEKIAVTNFFETKKHVVISYRLHGAEGKAKGYKSIFSKTEKHLTNFHDELGFENNLDNHIPFSIPKE